MKTGTREAVADVLKRVPACPIPYSHPSNEMTPSGGERRSRARGSYGDDVAALVPYEPGDDPRDIDHVASAQLNELYITQFLEPRDVQVFVITDVSPSMDFASLFETKRTMAARLAASIIKSAMKTQDLVGSVVFSRHHVHNVIRARSPSRVMFPTLASIFETEAPAEVGKDSGLCKGFAALPQQRSIVFILSDFSNMTEEEREGLRKTALRHDVYCLVIKDLRERELPKGPGIYALQDINTGESHSIWLSNKNRAQYPANYAKHEEELRAYLKETRCFFEIFGTDDTDAGLKLMRLFRGRRA